jgi:hypothetical protein
MQGTALGVDFIRIESKLMRFYQHTYFVYDAIFRTIVGRGLSRDAPIRNFPPHEYHYEVITQRKRSFCMPMQWRACRRANYCFSCCILRY